MTVKRKKIQVPSILQSSTLQLLGNSHTRQKNITSHDDFREAQKHTAQVQI
jgi:hypothetical protein